MERKEIIKFNKKNLNEIGKYLARIVVYCLGIKYLYLYACILTLVLMFPFGFFIYYLLDYPLSVLLENYYNYRHGFYFEDSAYIESYMIVISFFATYIMAKICGLFKKLDKVNFFVSLGIIIGITFLSYYFAEFKPTSTDDIYNLVSESFYPPAFVLIPCFILYKILYFLGKKYPIPFNRIGYYCSIEFFRDLIGKIRK